MYIETGEKITQYHDSIHEIYTNEINGRDSTVLH
jgi:hypothetical protein